MDKYNKKESNILNQINDQINKNELQQALRNVFNVIPEIVKLHRAMYKQMKQNGYTNEQSFKFASEYTFRIFKL